MNRLARCSIAGRSELQHPIRRGTGVKTGANGECVRVLGISFPGIQGTRLPRQGPVLHVHAECPKPVDAQHLHYAAHESGALLVVPQRLQNLVREPKAGILPQDSLSSQTQSSGHGNTGVSISCVTYFSRLIKCTTQRKALPHPPRERAFREIEE